MRYAYLLSLIDADLERLRMARQLLLTSATLQQRPGKKTVRLTTPVTGQRTGAISALPLGAKKQHPSRPRRDKARVFVPVYQGIPVRSPVSEASHHASSVVAGSVSSSEETIFRQELREQAPCSGGQSNSDEKAGLPLQPRKLMTFRPPPVARTPALPRTALSNPALVRPVFIPAEQVRQEQLQKQGGRDLDGTGSNFTAGIPLTAELLTKRWIQDLVG